MLSSRIAFDSSLVGTVHRLLSSSVNRRRLHIYAPQQGAITLSNDEAVTFGAGVVLASGQPDIMWSDERDGDIVQREWWIVYQGAFSPVAYVEVMATCAKDQAPIRDMMRGEVS